MHELSDTSDTQLLRQIANGDQTAVTLLYDRHSARLFGLAVAVVRERVDAEEVLLDAFAQAWCSASRFNEGRGTVIGWLATIVRSRALDLIRRRVRRDRAHDRAGERAIADFVAGVEGTCSSNVGTARMERDADRRGIIRALGMLPDAQRQVLELAYFGEHSHSAIADLLGVPLGTVKTRARLALRRLRTELAVTAGD